MNDDGVRDAIEERLARALATTRDAEVVVGFGANRRLVLATGVRARRTAPMPSSSAVAALALRQWPAGCVAKLLTSALALDAVRRGELALDGPVRLNGRDCDVSLRALLDHTHGLDDATITAPPRTRDGRIDAAALQPWSSPPAHERCYSYGDVGPWLAAAAVEQASGLRFDNALHRRVLQPAGITSRPARDVCPSRGGGWRLTVAELVQALNRAVPDLRDTAAVLTSPVTPLPGWHPIERGIVCGWKRYADGWLGHQSIVPGASLLARVQPAERRIIVIASSTHHAGVLAARLFGDTVPAFGMVSLPQRTPPDARCATRCRRYGGRYVRGRHTLVIEPAGGPGARGGGFTLIDGDTRTPLVPAERDILLADPAAPRPFVQPIQWDGERFRALWDGQRVLFNADRGLNAANAATARGSPRPCLRATPRADR